MEIFPAIDIKGGQVVRLTQGDYNQVEVYADSPAGVAAQFRAQGAKNLHMVDLDGARDGAVVNYAAVRAVVEAGGLFTQIGGGIRDEQRIRRYLDLGVNRVILGTAAVEDADFLTRMVKTYGKRIAVGVDARNGKVAVKGWRELTGVDSVEFCRQLEAIGVATIIYTDIARDGMQQGANLAVYRTLAKTVRCDIVASGGISFSHELVELANTGIYGAIIGKALYTGTLQLEEVLALC